MEQKLFQNFTDLLIANFFVNYRRKIQLVYFTATLNTPSVVLLVAEKSYRYVLAFLCHRRYDLFLTKILNFSLARLKLVDTH